MSKLADPTICPDCRSTLPGPGQCPGCGLRLTGPLAAELWQAMLHADSLVERLRARPAPGAADARGPVADVAGPLAPVAPRRARRRLPPASVPVVLLGLGGLCLLVSAAVFVAVTWSSLGVGGRTAILLLVTGVLGAAAAVVSSRGLRWAAETLWVVVGGMLALDVLGAHSAGLLGGLDGRHQTALLGLVLACGGATATAWSTGRATGRLHGPEVVAAIGLVLLTATEGWAATRPMVGTSVAIGGLAAVALLLRRPVPWTAYAAGALALLSWAVLAGGGLDRLGHTTGAAWWAGLAGWPLLVAAAYGTAVASWPAARAAARSVAAAGALACAALFVVGPVGSPTRDLLVGAALVAVLGLLAVVAPAVWARAAAALASIGGSVLAVELLARPWATLEQLPTTGRTPLAAQLPIELGHAAPWTSLPVAAAVLVAGWGAAACTPALRTRLREVLWTAAPALVGLAAGAVVLGSGAPLWVAGVAFAVALAAAALAVAWQQGDDVVELTALVLAAAVVAPSLRLAVTSHLLTGLCATALALLLVAGHRWLRPALLWRAGTTLLVVLGVLAGALAVPAWSLLGQASTATQSLALAGYAALIGLTARFGGRGAEARLGAEATALLVGLAGVGLAPTAATAAVGATIVGSAVCLVAATDPGRNQVGWLGAAVLGAATVLRLVADVAAPELYTLPAALVLLGAGAWRLRRDASLGSAAALGSGLSLALVPSLLLALDEPVSLRGVLLGVAGMVVLVVGVVQRWSTPFLAGAVTTGVLAVRHLGPVAEALPRWVSFGAVGLALLVVGITWESRRRDLGVAARYLTALR